MTTNNSVCIVGSSKRFLSGISYYTIRLTNALATEKSVSAICFRQLLPTILFPGKSHVGKNISELCFSTNIPIFDGMDYNNPITWLQAYNFIRKNKPDVIILQWWTASVAHMQLIVKLMSKLSYNPKIIIEFHEVIDPLEESILPIKLYAKFTGKLLRRNLNAYVAHSESDKHLVADRYAIPLDKIHVIPLGLFDHHEHTPYEKAKRELNINEEFVILSFGLIRNYKGIPYLIKAFEQLPIDVLEKSRLLIVGEIWENKEELLQQVELSPYCDKITLINDYIPDDKVGLYFSASNIVVLPYLRASQSGVAHIAMSFGKPVVVSNVGGLSESMADYTGTLFVKPADVNDITEAIVKNIEDKTYHKAPEQTWDEITKRYVKLIDSL